MSWDNTFSHAVAIGIDYLGAAICWQNRRLGLTMSAVAGIELRRRKRGDVGLSRRLLFLGDTLNRIQTTHTEIAIAADLARLQSDAEFLRSA